jgi:hypothetical protein
MMTGGSTEEVRMRWVMVLVVCLFATVAQAQDVVTIPEGDDVIISMDKGEPAPYAGQLYSTDTALRWGFWLQQYKFRLKLDVETEQAKCKARLDFKDKELQLQIGKYEAIEKSLETRLKRSEERAIKWQEEALDRSFFRSFEFGVIVGVVVSGVVAIAVAWGINQTAR